MVYRVEEPADTLVAATLRAGDLLSGAGDPKSALGAGDPKSAVGAGDPKSAAIQLL